LDRDRHRENAGFNGVESRHRFFTSLAY